MFVGKSAYLYIGGITRVTVIIGGKCEVGKRFRKKKKKNETIDRCKTCATFNKESVNLNEALRLFR